MTIARKILRAGLLTSALACASAPAAPAYHPITPTMADRTVVLDGHHLTIGEVVDVARTAPKWR